MIIALTGTPGTGKTSVANILRKKEFEVIDLNKFATDSGFIVGRDAKRESNIIDIESLNKHIKTKFRSADLVFIEGHLSHLLRSVDKIIILRCHPNILRDNLSKRNWSEKKIKENVEAEILDIILCEAVQIHGKENTFEMDVSDKSLKEITSEITKMVKNGFKNMKKYKIGKIDWSEEILKDF